MRVDSAPSIVIRDVVEMSRRKVYNPIKGLSDQESGWRSGDDKVTAGVAGVNGDDSDRTICRREGWSVGEEEVCPVIRQEGSDDDGRWTLGRWCHKKSGGGRFPFSRSVPCQLRAPE
jgi:hypothetical protein